MGIDPKSLPPKYQAQIADKLLKRENAARSPAAGFEGQRKYKNIPTERNGVEGKKIRFDSQKEARRFDELMLMLTAGTIRDLKLQPEFTLQEAYTTPEGVRVRAIRYRADFSYDEFCPALIATDGGGTWLKIIEDVKSKATKTRVYEIKKKLMRERLGIEIMEIE